MMSAIAREYAKGRLLLIGTTNIDLQRPVVWNIGAIAASGHPQALDLFRRILLASASPPGAFPPVLIDVEVNGRHFQEMHVDGGAVAQMFLYPAWLHLADWSRENGVDRKRTAWLIRNARAEPEPDNTRRQLLSVGLRAVSTLVHFGGINDLVRIYLVTRRDSVQFRLAFIDQDFNLPRREFFDQAYMRALFDHAYTLARNGYPWSTEPPGFSAADIADADRAGRRAP
jgi:predicted acylesterase/phospholipase RssA